MLQWQPNKIVTGHKTYKLGRQSSNDHNCQIWFTSLQWLWRKCNLTIFSYKSMRVFSCHGNKTNRQIGRFLAIFNCPYPSNMYTKLESYCFSGFGGVVIKKKKLFSNLMLSWKPNKMVTGHETQKMGRQSSNDHNCQIWFTSHCLWRKCNLTFFLFKSKGDFWCHGNETKRQITIILAILNCPYPCNICKN